MPTSAKLRISIGIGIGSNASKLAKPAPSVAPMKSEGEKIPPDDPEPRLSDVASSLHANSRSGSQAPDIWPSKIDWIVE